MEFKPESVFSDGEPEVIEVKSPIDQFREQWTVLPGPLPFLRQRTLLREHPELVPYAELARAKGWAQPLAFALQGLVVTAFLISALSWLITRDRGVEADQIAALHADVDAEMNRLEGVIDAAQVGIARTEHSRKTAGLTVGSSGPTLTKEEAVARLNTLIEETRKEEARYKYNAAIQERNLHALGDARALAHSGTPVIFVLALLFAAQLVGKGIQKDFGWFKLTRQADEYYLYYAVAEGVWINCVLVVLMHLGLSATAYGLGGLFGQGLIVRGIFWLLVYALLAYFFHTVSMSLYRVMQIPAPRKDDILGNKILLRVHNSFLMLFLPFEAALIVLCYGVYLLQKSVG